jgi:2-phosphosulfolactate phosphatase
MTTTNGTRAILASLEAERVLIGAFVNRGRLAESLAIGAGLLHIVCAGTEGEVSWEDTLLAGALAARLEREGWELANDSGRIAAELWLGAEHRIQKRQGEGLADELARGKGGRRVRQIGLERDIQAAAAVDQFGLLVEVRRDPLRIVIAGQGGDPIHAARGV